MNSILHTFSSMLKILLGISALLALGVFTLLKNREADELWGLALPTALLLLLLYGRKLYQRAGKPSLLRWLFVPARRFQVVKRIGLVVICGLVVRACVYSEYAWKEEVLLHDGSKIIVDRKAVYGNLSRLTDSPGGSHLTKQTLQFKIPGSYQSVTWVSTYGYSYGDDDLDFYVLSLDFLGKTPYLAAVTANCSTYSWLGRPNPPYFFFKYMGGWQGWQRIPITEFPEPFKINLISTFHREEIGRDVRNYGFLRAETVEDIIKKSNKNKADYNIITRTPFKPGSAEISCVEMVHFKCADGDGFFARAPESREDQDVYDKTCKQAPKEEIPSWLQM